MELKNYDLAITTTVGSVAQAPNGYHLSFVGGYLVETTGAGETVTLGIYNSGGTLKTEIPFILTANEKIDISTKIFLNQLETLKATCSTGTATIVLFGAETVKDSDNVPDDWSYTGDWLSTTTYAVNNIAVSGGTAYICTTVNLDSIPPNTNWDVFASKGGTGDVATITAGTTTTGAAGTNAAVANSGTSGAAILDFTIPQGDDGIAATVGVHATTITGNAGTDASVSNTGSTSAAVFQFTIPEGDAGTDGADWGGAATSNLDMAGYSILKSTYTQIADASLGTGTHTFNYAAGDMQQLTATADITIAFSNFTAGKVCTMIIDAVNWGAWTITKPAGMLFSDAEEPGMTAVGTDRVVVIKDKDDVYSFFVVGAAIAAVA